MQISHPTSHSKLYCPHALDINIRTSPSDSWKNSSECGKSMKFCLIVVYVMKNIFSYVPNLKIETGGNSGHFKKHIIYHI